MLTWIWWEMANTKQIEWLKFGKNILKWKMWKMLFRKTLNECIRTKWQFSWLQWKNLFFPSQNGNFPQDDSFIWNIVDWQQYFRWDFCRKRLRSHVKYYCHRKKNSNINCWHGKRRPDYSIDRNGGFSPKINSRKLFYYSFY